VLKTIIPVVLVASVVTGSVVVLSPRASREATTSTATGANTSAVTPARNAGPARRASARASAARLAQLPAWFLSSRVHMNSAIQVSELNTDNLAEQLSTLGVTVFMAPVKEKVGVPLWPTAAIAGRGRASVRADAVTPMVSALHRRGIKFIAYYFHSTDRDVARAMPQIACKDATGKVILYKSDRFNNDAPWLDITDDTYRDIVVRRVEELAALSVDGFNFDGPHL